MGLNSLKINQLRSFVLDGKTSSIKWRLKQLKNFEIMLFENEEKILKALSEDLGKPPTEAFFEIVALKQELSHTKKNLKKWMAPRSVKIPISLQPGKAIIRAQPLGCILIIGPWNYPFSLTLQPLISALAAGNTAVLKPSEHAPQTSHLIKRLIEKYFSQEILQVFEGDALTAKALLEEKFDHIFFTGGEKIGKEIMKSAAKYLTPITLELGGKSPAIVLEDTDVKTTAKRLIWGKGLNSGQTCIAPDYVLVKENIKEDLIKEMKKVIKEFYGINPLKSIDSARIVNNTQLKRLTGLLDNAIKHNQIITGGEIDTKQKRLTIALINVSDTNDSLMKEELFGPLLPILTIKSLDNAIDIIKQNPHPLAIYMFGGKEIDKNKLIEKTRSGGICLNDVVLQAGIPELPFGGIGHSGMGRYHGKAGFDTFSHERPILEKQFWFDIKFRYPPYKLDISFLKNFLG